MSVDSTLTTEQQSGRKPRRQSVLVNRIARRSTERRAGAVGGGNAVLY